MMILSKPTNPTRMKGLLSEGEMGENLRSANKLQLTPNNDTLLTWNHQSPSANDVEILIMLETTL